MRILAFPALLAILCASCSGTSRSDLPTLVRVPDVGSQPHKAGGEFLYVANLLSNAVTVYQRSGSNPKRSIQQAGGYTMAFAPSGDLYASNGAPDNGNIKVYAAGTAKHLRTIHDTQPISLAVDRNGYLYVADGGDGVIVYRPGSTRIDHVIQHGVACVTLALDAADNLYVACQGQVLKYAPSASPGYPNLVREIRNLHQPHALAFGPSGNVFVALYRSVSVYQAGDLTFLRTCDDIPAPTAIAVDSIGRLYVTSSPFTREGYQPGSVFVYAAGRTKPLRKITAGIDVPRAVILDADDNVYVANTWGNSVSVFAPGAIKRLRTITNGISGPDFLQFSVK